MSTMSSPRPMEVLQVLCDGEWFRRVVRALLADPDDDPDTLGSPLSPSPPVASADEAVVCAALRLAVVEAVLAVGEPARTALLLRFCEGKSLPAIARLTKTPEPIVRERLRRGLTLARAELSSRLAREDAEVPGGTGALRVIWLARLRRLAGGPPRNAPRGAVAGSTQCQRIRRWWLIP